MYFTLTCSPSSTTSLIPILSPSHQNSVFNYSSFSPKQHRRRQVGRFSIKSSHKPLNPLLPPTVAGTIRFSESSTNSTLPVEKQQKSALSCDVDNADKNNILKWIAKPIVFTLFCIAIGLCPVCSGFQLPAFAVTAPAAAVSSDVKKRTKSTEKDVVVLKQKDHEYSDCTRRLLVTVSGLLRSIEEVRSGNGDLKAVEAALREVKSKKRELQDEIMNGLYAELRGLKGEKENLVKQSEEILGSVLKAKGEQESLLSSPGDGSDAEEVKEQIAKLEEEMLRGEREYNGIWEKVGEIEDRILRRETMALSIGVRELSFIERESQLLVEKFRREMRQRSSER